MKILLQNIGKRFNQDWIFRNVNFEFTFGNKYAILGTNGCGKSTLLQIIAGASSQTEGNIQWNGKKDEKLMNHQLFKNISYAAPYLELPEEMTWAEVISFHGKFNNYVSGFSEEKIISLSGLELSAKKEIRNFSSGMKQRARLALAILSDTSLLLLDEPSTNLDVNAVAWYQKLMKEFSSDRLIIVCSNYNKEEYPFCNQEFILSNISL